MTDELKKEAVSESKTEAPVTGATESKPEQPKNETVPESKIEAPVTGATESKPEQPKKTCDDKRSICISIAVAVIIIAAALCAYVFLTPYTAKTGDTVEAYYTLTFENGTFIESNLNGTPTVFTIGNGTVLKGFEEGVIGMSLNQEKTVDVPYEKAFGAYNSSLVQTVNRTGPIANTTFIEGMVYTVHDRETGHYSTITILNVTPTTVTWDANSPLAGENLTFTIRVANITRHA
ncbi:MAG: FKBP-type peptidyl-prolyl cis-trans isomerase [Methanoregula sp.]|jgi:peptidylprolyl isomerase